MEVINSFLRKQWPYALLVLLAIAFGIFRTCDGETGGGGEITFSPPVKAPVAISIIDANRLASKQIPKATVTLVDPGGMVVTPNNFSFTTIEIDQGVMSLALKNEAEFSPRSPYRFSIRVEAEGYNSNSRNILIWQDEEQYVPIFMVQVEDPPIGMAGGIGSVPLVAGEITEPLSIVPNKTNNLPLDNIQLDFTAGTMPIYCDDDEPVTSFPEKLDYRISYASPTSVAAARTFPGGTLITDAVADGEVIASASNPAYFESAGWINIEMEADGKVVNGFTKPVKVTTPIPDTLINPQTEEPFKVNDQIDIWSLSNGGVWRKEQTARVQGSPGKLFAVMEVSHLSTWNLDNKVNACAVPPAPALTINYTNTSNGAGTTNRFSELVRVSTGLPLRFGVLSYDNAATGGSHDIINARQGVDMALVIHDNPTMQGNIISTSTPLSCNSTTASLSIPSGNASSVDIAFRVVPAAGSNNPSAICANAVWFRQCTGSCSSNACQTNNANTFQYGGILSASGQTGTTTLTNSAAFLNNDYCIRLWYAGVDNQGNTVSQTVDFLFRFTNVVPNQAIIGRKTIGGNPSNLSIFPSVNNNVYLFEIINAAPDGVTPINSCT